MAEHRPQLVDHRSLYLASRHAAYGTGSCAMFQHGLADVIAVKPVLLAGVAGRKCRAVRPKQQALQQGGRLRAGVAGALARAFLQDSVHLVPEFAWNDSLVLARVSPAVSVIFHGRLYGLVGLGVSNV